MFNSFHSEAQAEPFMSALGWFTFDKKLSEMANQPSLPAALGDVSTAGLNHQNSTSSWTVKRADILLKRLYGIKAPCVLLHTEEALIWIN